VAYFWALSHSMDQISRETADLKAHVRTGDLPNIKQGYELIECQFGDRYTYQKQYK
jgi:hypothetical protein